MSHRRAILMFFLAGALASGQVHAACQAEVDVVRFWVEDGGFKQNAKLKGTVSSARPGAFVKIHVDVRFHFERLNDGWTNTASTSDSFSIDTSDHSSETYVIDTRASNCGKGKECKINDVEITDISCYD